MSRTPRNLPAWRDLSTALDKLAGHKARTEIELAVTLLVLQARAAEQERLFMRWGGARNDDGAPQ